MSFILKIYTEVLFRQKWERDRRQKWQTVTEVRKRQKTEVTDSDRSEQETRQKWQRVREVRKRQKTEVTDSDRRQKWQAETEVHNARRYYPAKWECMTIIISSNAIYWYSGSFCASDPYLLLYYWIVFWILTEMF